MGEDGGEVFRLLEEKGRGHRFAPKSHGLSYDFDIHIALSVLKKGEASSNLNPVLLVLASPGGTFLNFRGALDPRPAKLWFGNQRVARCE